MLASIANRKIVASIVRSAYRPFSTPVKSATDNADPSLAFTPTGKLREPKKDVFHYTDRQSGVGYSHFSNTVYQHRPYIWPPLRKLFYVNFYMAIGLLVLTFFDYEWLYKELCDACATFTPEASQLTDESAKEGEEDDEEKQKKPKKAKVGFRERRMIEYENRLRMYSTPEKIFRYFATLKVVNENDSSGRSFEVFMTPEDFLRSFTPGVMQPRKYGLDRFKVYQPQKYKHNFSDPNSIFYKLGENGLITFSDYLFLMTLLSTSPKDFELAFQIFDTNGDGALDIHEFRRVQELVMSQSSVGQKHRDHSTNNYSFREQNNSVLEKYFFGQNKEGRLSPEKFLKFQADLHRDVLQMEFERRIKDNGGEDTLSYKEFAEMIMQYAEIPEKKRKAMMKRLKRRMTIDGGVNLEQFFHVMFHIDDIEVALHFHRMAGKSLAPALFKRVARLVAGVDLPDDIIHVVVALFDENGDGRLCNEEFVYVVRRRLQRGLERPRDTGLFRFLDAVKECSLRVITGTPLG